MLLLFCRYAWLLLLAVRESDAGPLLQRPPPQQAAAALRLPHAPLPA
jgi:hypothetical protein